MERITAISKSGARIMADLAKLSSVNDHVGVLRLTMLVNDLIKDLNHEVQITPVITKYPAYKSNSSNLINKKMRLTASKK